MKNENKELLDAYIYIHDTFKEIKAIKELIKENIEYKNNELSFKNTYSFADDLLKLIKYIDADFYNKLKEKQQGAEQ